jgi:hypothetical protein
VQKRKEKLGTITNQAVGIQAPRIKNNLLNKCQ